MTSIILQQHAKYSSLENPNWLESEHLEIGTIIKTVKCYTITHVNLQMG